MDFATFLIGEIGPTKAGLQVKAQIEHVLVLERRLPDAQPPTSDQLLTHFTSAEFRKAELFFRCLKNLEIPVPTRQELEDEAERRRTQTSIALAENNLLLPSIQAYRQKLIERETTPKSIRLSIHAAVAFSMFCHGIPSDDALTAYLTQAPGQRSAIYGFIVFLRDAGRLISPPAKRVALPRQVASTDGRTIVEVAQITTTFAELKSLVAAMLTATTGVALETCVRLPRSTLVSVSDSGLTLCIGDLKGEVPEALASLLTRYLSERDAKVGTASLHLFPGRPSTEPITVSVVRHHLKKWGLSIEKMGISARIRNKRALRGARQTAPNTAR